MEQIKRYKAVITGNVQGVGLRVFVMDNASKLGITGWVRNMADGTVEMEAQGNPDKLDQLFATIKKVTLLLKLIILIAQKLTVLKKHHLSLNTNDNDMKIKDALYKEL